MVKIRYARNWKQLVKIMEDDIMCGIPLSIKFKGKYPNEKLWKIKFCDYRSYRKLKKKK